MPSDLLCGEDVIWVNTATVSVDLLAVDPRRTGAGLEVQTYAREVYEFARAPRAFDVFPEMDRRFQMLIKGRSVRRSIRMYLLVMDLPDSSCSKSQIAACTRSSNWEDAYRQRDLGDHFWSRILNCNCRTRANVQPVHASDGAFPRV